MKRPLWTCGVTFGLALLLSTHLSFTTLITVCAVLLILTVFAVGLPVWRKTVAAPILFSAFVATLLFAVTFMARVEAVAVFDKHAVEIDATVTDIGTDYLVATSVGGDLPEDSRLIVYTDTDRVLVGSRLRGLATVYLREDERLLHGARLFTADPLSVSDGEGLRWQLAVWQQTLSDTFADSPVRGILSAMCFGDTRHLDEATTTIFRRSGTAHLLCVSGLHLSIITAAALAVLQRLRRPFWLRPVLAMLCVLLYMGLTGFHYSVLRAGIMQLLFLSAQLFRRDADSRNSLGAALLLILLFDPLAVFDAGLWMSVAATVGILLLYPALRQYLRDRFCRKKTLPARLGGCILDALSVSVCTTVAITPVQLLVFGTFTWISPLVNLFAVPVATPIVICGCLAAILAQIPFLAWLSQACMWVAEQLSRYLHAVSSVGASVPYASTQIQARWLILFIIGVYLLVGFGWILAKKRGVLCGALAALLILTAGSGSNALAMRGVTTFTAIPAENGTVLFSQDSSDRILLIKAGNRQAVWQAATYLHDCGIYEIDWLLWIPDEGGKADDLAMFFDKIDTESVAVSSDTTLPVVWPSDFPELVFWEQALSPSAEWRIRQQSGFLQITVKNTRLLITPPDGNTADLPDDWLQTHIVLFDRAPPLHATAIDATHGVVCCKAASVSSITKALPWSLYPCSFAAVDEVMLRTRGAGDILLVKEG